MRKTLYIVCDGPLAGGLLDPLSTARRPFALVPALVLTLLALGACQHSEAVQKLEEEAKARANGSAGSSGIPIVRAPVRDTGAFPAVVLAVSEADIGEDMFEEPVVDENDRSACGDTEVRDTYVPDPAIQAEAQGLLSQMSVPQKVLQLTGVEPPPTNAGNRFEDIQRSRDDSTLNLRGYLWRDGPHGLNLESGLGRRTQQNYSTSFPTSVAQGASFDLDLVERVGRAMGDETAASGNNVLLGPCMNILRHPYWGRAQETFGEDVFHLGRIATAFTLGLQEFVSGCAKHYAANNIENKRFFINAVMDEQTLREIYARHFEMVVRDGGVGCIMASYNLVNGTKSTQNFHTLSEVLRNDFGFHGFVLTDWWAMPGADRGHGPIDPPVDGANAAEALQAGLDVELPWTLNYDAIPQLLADRAISVPLVDRAVLRVLEQKLRFQTAYLDGPMGPGTPTTRYDATVGSMADTEAHAALAAEAAEKAMVLLKNDGSVLPISGATTVAVLGAIVPYTVPSDSSTEKMFNFAIDLALGDRGSSRVRPDPALSIGPADGIRAAAPTGVEVISGSSAAEAADADVVVVVVGLTAGEEGEEYTGASDRESLALLDAHNTLVEDVIDLGKPTIVIVQAGSAVNMPWIGAVDAAIMAWYPGQRSGEAMGRLLFGEANFAGRLPITWPTSDSQLPVFSEPNDTTAMDYYIGYRRFDQLDLQPLFAFGHGLSYSTFRYERLHVPCGQISKNGVFVVEVDVRNIEGPAGDEVIQIYASYPETGARRSVKELKGFAKVHLEPGQGKRVSIPIRVQDLKYWDDTGGNSWVVESGPVLLQVGPSSDRLLFSQTLMVD